MNHEEHSSGTVLVWGQHVAVDTPEGVSVRAKSQLTGKMSSMKMSITREQIKAWLGSGKVIQDAFPKLTGDQREFLMTGITPEEWDEAFKEDEDAP